MVYANKFNENSDLSTTYLGQTKMSYEKVLRIQKEHCQPYDFCGAADMLAGTTVHVSYSHISIIYAFPILYVLNKLILMFNVAIIG